MTCWSWTTKCQKSMAFDCTRNMRWKMMGMGCYEEYWKYTLFSTLIIIYVGNSFVMWSESYLRHHHFYVGLSTVFLCNHPAILKPVILRCDNCRILLFANGGELLKERLSAYQTILSNLMTVTWILILYWLV
jgi:hypothetical protein